MPHDSAVKRPDAVIFDIDGTLAHKGDRDPYDVTTVINDSLNPATFLVLSALWNAGLDVIYCSGRMEAARRDTMGWLRMHGAPISPPPAPGEMPHTPLFMRPNGDMQPDQELKKKIYKEFIEPFYNVRFVFDDRDKVVRMWREDLGLPCFQVAYGNF